jgi:tetratricopeptide (TPR) repeat protein
MTPRSKIPTLVASAAVLGALGAGAAVVADEATHTNSAELFKALKDAHDDLTATKYADAISKLKAAETSKGKTPYDQHLINDQLTFAYVRTGAYADAAKTMEAEVDDGFTSPADQPQKVRALAVLNYQLKNYDKAIGYGQRAIKGGRGDGEMQRVVGQAYYLKGDWKDTRDFEDELVTGHIRRGETPAKESLLLLYSACVKLQDNECVARALGWLNGYYPGVWRPDLRAPPPPQWGTVMAFFFGPPDSPEGQKPSTTK